MKTAHLLKLHHMKNSLLTAAVSAALLLPWPCTAWAQTTQRPVPAKAQQQGKNLSPGQPGPAANKPLPALAMPAAAAPQTPAEKDYAAFQELRRTPPGSLKALGRQGMHQQVDKLWQRIIAEGLAFCEKYPTDPLRWRVVDMILPLDPPFVLSYGPKFQTLGLKDAVIDSKAKAAWQAKRDALERAINTAPDVPPELLEERAWTPIARAFRERAKAAQEGKGADWTALRVQFDAHTARFSPQEKAMLARADEFVRAIEQVSPGEGVREWERLETGSPNSAIRALAAAKLNRQPAFVAAPKTDATPAPPAAPAANAAPAPARPIELVFIAADGRAVDVAALRGKVVLIYFWGTWSKASVAALPDLKRAYRDYQAKGFEVVGISIEDAGVPQGATPAQAADRLAAAKKAFLDYLAKEGITWPQYYDGKGIQNEFVSKFGIKGVPATVLLNQQGVPQRVNLAGGNLEKELKKLLKP